MNFFKLEFALAGPARGLLPLALAQVEGQEMWDQGSRLVWWVGSSAPLHTAAAAP